MAIKGVIFDNQKPTAKQMGGVFRPLYSDGIMQGCSITYSGSDAFVASGEIMICGRPFELTSKETIQMSGTGLARIIVNCDLSKSATASSFAQVYFTTETVDTASSFAQLTQDNVNKSGTLYQMELARFTISGGTITGKVSTIGNVGVTAEFCKFLGATYYGTSLPAPGNAGRIFFLKAE